MSFWSPPPYESVSLKTQKYIDEELFGLCVNVNALREEDEEKEEEEQGEGE